MFHLPESRFIAFGIHLLLSLGLFTALSLFCYFILLPGFLFYSEGGLTILTLIGGVDVVLGPLVTLVIYKKTKPKIKMDLAIIALIQIAALLYGLHSLWSVRPMAVFYAKGEYHVAYESDLKESLGFPTPTLAISLPDNHSLYQAVISHKLMTGASYFDDNSRHSAYEEQIPSLSTYGLSIKDANAKGLIKDNSHLMQYKDGPFRVYSFQSSLKPGYMVVNTETGKFVAMVN